MIRDSAVLLDFGVWDRHGKVLFQTLVRVANFTEDVYRLEVSATCAAGVSLQRTCLMSLLGGTRISSIEVLQVLQMLFSVLNILLEHLG